MRSLIVRAMLAILNSSWLNGTPARFGFIGNIDAFDIEHLRAEVSQRPDLSVATVIAEAELCQRCAEQYCASGEGGLKVIENGEMRDGTIWDAHELRMALEPRPAPNDPGSRIETEPFHPMSEDLRKAIDADSWNAPHRLLIYAMKRYVSIHGAETALAAAQLVAEGLPHDSGTAVDERIRLNRLRVSVSAT